MSHMEIFRCRMADARMDQLAEQITETRGLIEELRDQLMPIAEVRFKQAALERQHRLRIQDELQQLRQQFHEYQLRQDLLQARVDRICHFGSRWSIYKKKSATWLGPYFTSLR